MGGRFKVCKVRIAIQIGSSLNAQEPSLMIVLAYASTSARQGNIGGRKGECIYKRYYYSSLSHGLEPGREEEKLKKNARKSICGDVFQFEKVND